jgi:hypothetical protein
MRDNNHNRDLFGRQSKAVRDVLGDYPIVEATADILIYVSAADAEEAIPGDPNNCIFAKACKRSYGSRGVLFFPTIAYIDMPNEHGERVVFRAGVKEATRRAIEALDLAGERREGTFRLYAIPKSNTLAVMKKNQRRRTQELKKSKRSINPVRSAAAKKSNAQRKAATYIGLRDGAGAIRTHEAEA